MIRNVKTIGLSLALLCAFIMMGAVAFLPAPAAAGGTCAPFCDPGIYCPAPKVGATWIGPGCTGAEPPCTKICISE